ncbi:MAG: DNA primase [Paramuribaculum sp.]|nr:DNA primase [Paramuribaculum sp.]
MPKSRIDSATVQRILDASDIVEVVSDFVHLKRRGSGFIGLCPFHNERTPSFSVSKSKGICKCFSCGKGGSPVNFIMEIEQVGYSEALRYLARKYNIEIQERELTAEEREEASQREAMMAVNDFAMQTFEHNLTSTPDGRDIGLAYFHERGINDTMISRFHLGYSLEGRTALYDEAIARGYKEEFLLSTGLCLRAEQGHNAGQIRDRFRGRVMYPVFSVSGKVVAFGGRTLRSDKEVAKYVNSPESLIYHKSNVLYGLYQAKKAIVQHDKCILVEGYMDVISMHQAGVENVVASSGTSLTEGQIRLIHRFTDNVTVIYDSDPAGIKASLRGIDMLLAEGLNVKVLLLPDGDDPDSFAQSHSSSQVEQYIADNETDFIRFKTSILLQGADRDPIVRSKAIADIVMSISMIPDQITRSVYIAECSRTLDIPEKVLNLQVAKNMADKAERDRQDDLRRRNRQAISDLNSSPQQPQSGESVPVAPAQQSTSAGIANVSPTSASSPSASVTTAIPTTSEAAFFDSSERDLLTYVIRYGMVNFCEVATDDPTSPTRPMSVIEYVHQELEYDEISFTNEPYRLTFQAALHASRIPLADELHRYMEQTVEPLIDRERQRGEEEIRLKGTDMTTLQRLQKELDQRLENMRIEGEKDFRCLFISRRLASDPDDTVRRVTTDLMSERHKLSKIYSRFGTVTPERDTLDDSVPRAVYAVKNMVILHQIRLLTDEIKNAYASPQPDLDLIMTLMTRQSELQTIKRELSRYLGDRVVTPLR